MLYIKFNEANNSLSRFNISWSVKRWIYFLYILTWINIATLKIIFFIARIYSRLLETFDIIFTYISFDCLDSTKSKSILSSIIWSIALNKIYEDDLNIDNKSAVKNWIECLKWKNFKKENLSSVLEIIKD